MITNHVAYLTSLDSKHSSFSQEDDENVDACIANISPLERKKRMQFGVIQLAIGVLVLIALIIFGADRLWRLPLLLIFWAAAVGYFQARDKT